MNIAEAIQALIACVGEERFREELDRIRAGNPSRDDRTEERELIQQVLREMGIREGTNSMPALAIGVELTLEYDMDISCRIMKEIVPEVARQMGKSAGAAEKNIRWGIEGAWRRMDPAERVRWFGHAGVKPGIGGAPSPRSRHKKSRRRERIRRRLTLEDVNNIITDLEENAMVNNEMPMYIGTKIVQAEPMTRGDYIVQAQQFITKWMEDLKAPGYKVVYEDGYESWSPKEVFEAAYRLVDGMNFGLALEAAKMGEKIARKGWNGKGMYVFLVHGVDFHTDADLSELDDQDVEVLDCLVMRTATGAFCPGWLASQTDMLADDWMIVGG